MSDVSGKSNIINVRLMFHYKPEDKKEIYYGKWCKIFYYYAELTSDNSFLISGVHRIFDPILDYPHHIEGHVIGLKPDGTPSTLSSSNSEIEAIFSVQENPVINTFTLIKSLNNNNPYMVNILDVSGKNIASSQDWNDSILSINVSKFTSGTYIYTISGNKKLIYSGKFIKI
ncbi:MAG: T9SS type A sorting domain-containing protein [Saprospiraceae bacterium]|nr:T9SS type A sorting domain-containing protein [Saprospiraceae bacterium]